MEKSRAYAGLFIISPEKQEALEEVKDSINTIVKDNSGNIVKENVMGKRSLAYPIKKQREGIYYELFFTALPGSISKMMRLFQINTDILRALIDKNE